MKGLLTLALGLTLAAAVPPIPPALSCSSAGICFASGLSSGAVLQRSPEVAVAYGSALGPPGAPIHITLASSNGSFTHTVDCALAADGTWRAVLPAMPTGGNFSLRAACPSCAKRKDTTINDLTFGDVFYAGGQSNMWLPLWFTYSRNTTLAAVRRGQYSNIRLWRGGLGKVAAPPASAGNWVGPEGVEPGSDDGNDALTNQWRRPADVAAVEIRAGEPWFWEFPATAFYFAMYLTDLIAGGGGEIPPLGIMTTPVGGTMVEEWTSPRAQATCRNVTCMCMDDKSCDPYKPLDATCTHNSDLFYGNVQPFVNFSVKAFLWYQGCVCPLTRDPCPALLRASPPSTTTTHHPAARTTCSTTRATARRARATAASSPP